MRLRDGSEVQDTRLGRLVQDDPRNANFPIRTLLPDRPLRSYSWALPTWLNQGNTPQCVGYSWTHEIAARPRVHQVDAGLATRVYHMAQDLDEWPGSNYAGTSVLAGAKAVQQLGYLTEYRWAFNLQDALAAIAWHGPVVFGLSWHRGMSRADEKGYIHPTGPVDGGHAIMGNRISVTRQAVFLSNSWGRDWAVDGGAWITFDELGQLLADDGECCVPVRRL